MMKLTVTQSAGPAGWTLARARVRVVITRPSIAAAHSLITVDDLIWNTQTVYERLFVM